MKKTILFLLTAFLLSSTFLIGQESSKLPKELKDNKKEAEEKPTPSKAMLTFHGQDLFEVGMVSSVTAEQRRDVLAIRLKRLANSPTFRTDILEISSDENLGVSMIFSGENLVCTTWEQEATLLGDSRENTTKMRMKSIEAIIDQYRKDHTLESIAKGAMYAILATLALLLIFTIISRLIKKQRQLISNWIEGKKLFGIIESDGIIRFNKAVMRFIQIIIMLWVFVIYLNFVLSFFPWTFNWSAALFEMLSSPLKRFYASFVAYLPDMVTLGFIIGATYFIIHFVHNIFDQIEEGKIRIEGFYPDWAPQTFILVRLVLIIVAGVAAFPYIPGSNSPAFKGISLFVGVLFSLGSTSAVGNIFAGLVLTYMRPFSPGDYVEVSDTKGVVIDRRTFSMRIRTPKNVIVTIPNILVSSNHIVNYSRKARKEGVFLHTAITIGYDAPWRLIHELLIKAAKETSDVLKDPEPFVLQSGLEDFYVRYELNVATHVPDRWPRIHSELHQRIQDLFAESDIEIMSPHYRHNRTGNETTIPSTNKTS